MKNLEFIINPQVAEKFKQYPPQVKKKIKHLRKLIIDTAKEHVSIDKLEETLKWGEPSYLTKNGSTIRIDWKEKNPNQYAMYFKCTSKLVSTFKVVFGDTFKYENTRAILFTFEDEIPTEELKECIEMALTYHTIKDKPLLGRG